jgi:hypothetical protein
MIPWGLTLRFLMQLAIGLWLLSPLLLVLVLMLLGYLAGKEEGWTRFDSFYWAFVTATTGHHHRVGCLCRDKGFERNLRSWAT